ncbi:MAG: SAM-dependent chlorinase/fluorinase, partial [Bacteroidales bacterium]
IIGVNTIASPDRPYVAIKADGHFFIGCDNGIFGLILNKDPETVILIKPKVKEATFPGLYLFVDAACHLAMGKKITDLGKQVRQYAKRVPLRAAIDESVITGSVIYIDSYQNAITNITRDLFNRVGKDRPFEILVTSNYYKISKLNDTYGETAVGEILALFNSLDLLEIAINNGNAANLLNLSSGSGIRVHFKDTKGNKKQKK